MRGAGVELGRRGRQERPGRSGQSGRLGWLERPRVVAARRVAASGFGVRGGGAGLGVRDAMAAMDAMLGAVVCRTSGEMS